MLKEKKVGPLLSPFQDHRIPFSLSLLVQLQSRGIEVQRQVQAGFLCQIHRWFSLIAKPVREAVFLKINSSIYSVVEKHPCYVPRIILKMSAAHPKTAQYFSSPFPKPDRNVFKQLCKDQGPSLVSAMIFVYTWKQVFYRVHCATEFIKKIGVGGTA